MRIVPGPNSDETIIEPVFSTCRLRLRGLEHDQARALLLSEARGRNAWHPGLSVSAELTDVPPDPQGSPQIIELEDGRVYLQSGASGHIEVNPEHALGNTLLPTSLNLLLAQQWARAGLLMVHGAAFRFDSTGVLVLGDQGAGKSTLTAAVLTAGGEVVSDDWLLVGIEKDGHARAERLRGFLMFRDGPMIRRLAPGTVDLELIANPKTGKIIAPIDGQPDAVKARLPNTCGFERIWLLRCSSGKRQARSLRSPAANSKILAAIVRATMPLLFSRRFPIEQRALRDVANRLSTERQAEIVETGTDLVGQPAQALGRLVAP